MTSSQPAGTLGEMTPEERKGTITGFIGASAGNFLEAFDWVTYGVFAATFATQIFNPDNARTAVLESFAIFAVGFFARPLGGALFGWIGDRIGRRASLTTSVLTASLGSFLVGITPTYASWGIWAGMVFLVARVIQGLAHGGELPAAQTYIAEIAPPPQRGLYASAIYGSGSIALLLALLMASGLNSALTAEQLQAWGWRVPFILGGVAGLFILWLRRHLVETEAFEEQQAEEAEKGEKPSLLADMITHWRPQLKVVFLTSGLTVAFYVWTIMMPSLAQTSFGYTAGDAFAANIIATSVGLVSLPIWGWISDRIGRRPCIIIGMSGVALLYFPMFNLIARGEFWGLATAVTVQVVLINAFVSHAPATYAEMFPTSMRTIGFGFAYSICVAVFGGTAGYVLTWLDDPNKFAIYSITLLVITVLTTLTMPETKGKDLTVD